MPAFIGIAIFESADVTDSYPLIYLTQPFSGVAANGQAYTAARMMAAERLRAGAAHCAEYDAEASRALYAAADAIANGARGFCDYRIPHSPNLAGGAYRVRVSVAESAVPAYAAVPADNLIVDMASGTVLSAATCVAVPAPSSKDEAEDISASDAEARDYAGTHGRALFVQRSQAYTG